MFTPSRLHNSYQRGFRFLFVLQMLLFTVYGLNAQSDIAVSKIASTATAAIGDPISFDVIVTNEGTTTLTGVEVTDMVPANTTFVSSSGSGTYNSGTGLWSIASIAAGSTVTFTVSLEVTGQGIIYNLAEVTALDQVDDDSTPGNGNYNEDDISSACVSVPVQICPGLSETLDVSVPVTGLTNIQWFRDTGSGPVAFGTGSPITISQEGTYTFTADNSQGCSAGNCCPLIIEEACFDLALTKVPVVGAVVPGGDKEFTITIYNQGDYDAYNIEVSDYLPTGLSFNATNAINTANNWTLVGGVPTSIITGPLASGANTTLSIVLTVDANFQGTSLVNSAEISAADDDTDGSNTAPSDVDSTADTNMANDAGGAENTASDDEVNGDGTGAPNGAVAATDEDDEDPAEFPVNQNYDLSLAKTITSVGPYAPGDNVTYQITVTNDGTLNASNVVVTDNLPAGLTFVSSPEFGATAPHTATITSLPAGGVPVVLTLVAQIDGNFMGTTLTNLAEITTDDGMDVDSTPDNNDMNEDDQDAVPLTIGQTFDLALTKMTAPGTYSPGDDVVFDLVVYNQGSLDAYNVEITDYIPMDLNFDPSNPINILNNWTLVGAYPTATIAGPIAAGSNITVQLALQVDPGFQSTLIVNKAEISGFDDDLNPMNTPPTDVDSTPDLDEANDAGGFAGTASDDVVNGDGTGVPNDTNPATDEDDADPSLITVSQTYDLALTKVADLAGPYNAGDNVSYTISVTNQGSQSAANIEVFDLIPIGMSFVSSPDFTATTPHTALISSITPGATVDVTLVLNIDASFTGTSLVNEAEIVIDNGNDSDSTPGDGMGDDFDDDTIIVNQSYDLAIDKSVLSTGPFTPGGFVDYQIVVTNEGSQPVSNIEVTDFIPAGMTFSSSTDFDPIAPHVATIGTLGVGMSTTLNITLQINPSFMATLLTNEAEITLDDGDDNDSTPGDGMGDDFDAAPISVEQIYDLELVKNIITPGSYAPGDIITYEIIVLNNGTLDAANIDVVDFVPTGLVFAGSADFTAVAPHTATIGTLLAGASQTLSIDLQIDPSFMGNALLNEAEVTVDDGSDFDSTPNDGTGDDFDDALININQEFDLALTKMVTGSGFAPGDIVSFDLTVYNQGTLDAYNVVLTDYLPAGLNFDPNNAINLANNWTSVAGNPTTIVGGPIAPGTSQVITLELEIDPGFMSNMITNTAEISAADDDTDSGNAPPTDIDSAFDTNDTNDAGGLISSMADNSITGDGTGTIGDGNAATDEDDSDPALVLIEQMFDLALIKVVSSASPYNAGDDITYTITVLNQGSIDAYNIDVVDYLPANLIYDPTNAINIANNWTQAGTNLSTSIVGPLSANGGTMTLDLVLQVDTNFTNGSISNFAEITNADDDTNPVNTPPTDVDSVADMDDTNDAGGMPNSNADDYINGDGTGVPGDSINTTDEDDHDGSQIQIEAEFDLALVKTVSTSQGPTMPGELVTFTIEVFNQGVVTANDIVIADYFPSSLTLEDPNWALVGGFATRQITVPGGLLPNRSTMVDITFRVASNLGSGVQIINTAEISSANDDSGTPQTDSDSTMDNDDTNDVFVANDDLTSAAGDEDDHDQEVVTTEVFDLALRKTRLNTENVIPGGDVIFVLEVFNQGTITATNVEIFEYIPTGFTLSPNDMNGWALAGPDGFNTIAGPIAPNSSATLQIVLRADANLGAGVFINRAEIFGAEDGSGNDMTTADNDSTADNDESNDSEINDNISDDGTFDEDDADAEMFAVALFDLALQKTASSASPITLGQDVTFTISVFNQGGLTATNIEVIDFIPADFILSAANGTTWSMSGANATTTIATLAGGAQTSVDIILTAASASSGLYENIAEISSAQDDQGVFVADVDSTPDTDGTNDNFIDDEINDDGALDEDDNDRAPVMVMDAAVFDIALRKTNVNNIPYTIGDDVTFNIEIFNQGNTAVSNVSIIDYLPASLALSINDTNGWNTAGGNVQTIVAGPIAPNTSTIVSLVATVVNGAPAGNITNIAEVTAFEDGAGNDVSSMDIDSQADGNPGNDLIQDDIVNNDGTLDEDDHDIALAQIEIVDIALLKRVSVSQNMPIQVGDEVLFEIEVYNQGSVDLANVVVVDYLPAGLSLSVNDTNGWTGSGSLTTTLPGTLAAGVSSIAEVLVVVNSMGQLENVAEVSALEDTTGRDRTGDDIDSTPDSDPTNEGSVTDNVIDGTGGDEDDSDIELIDVIMCEDVVASNDAEICLGESIQLNATLAQPGVSYSWMPTAGLSCTTCSDPIATPNTTVNYQVTATYGACTSTDGVTVTVLEAISIDGSIVDMDCCIGGSISLNVTGGQAPYLVTWSDPTLGGFVADNLPAGSYSVTIIDDANCTSAETFVVGNNCGTCPDIVAQDTIFVSANNPNDLCLPFTFQESQNVYEVILAGTGNVAPIDGCDIDSVVFYTYSLLVGQGNSGPYSLDRWTCANGVQYSGIFQDMNELADSMNVWDPAGTWSNDPSTFTITGGADNTFYGDIEITHIGTNIQAFINPNIIGIAQGQLYEVPNMPGSYQYTITDIVNCCSDVVVVEVLPAAGITPDFTSYFTEVNNPVFLCVNTTELATTPISLDFCEMPDNGTVIFDSGNECMTYIPDPSYVGLDSFCVVVCDESGICDTTFVDVTISDQPHTLLDTITFTVPQNTGTGFQCTPWQKFFSTGFDTLIVCGTPQNGTLMSDGDSDCFEYMPDTDYCGRDSICLITCSDLNVCGTFTIYFDVTCGDPMPNPDTVFVSVLVNTILEDACVPLDELNGSFDTLFLCGEATNGTVVTNDTDHCVDYTPDLNYIGPDEYCVVVCDSIWCDTTYFIIDVVGTACDSIVSDVSSIEAEACDENAVLCLPFDIVELSEYIVTLDGDQYMNGFVGCDFDTTFSYNYFTIPGEGQNGPYVLDQWIVDGQAFNGNFVDVADLVALMNSIDASSVWTLDAMNFRIRGGNPSTDYGDMFITQPLTQGTAQLQFNENLSATKAAVLLPVGMHDVRLTHTTGCPIYEFDVTVACEEVFIDTIPYTIMINDTLEVCPDDLGILDPITGVFNNCPTQSGTEADVSIDPNTGCITMIGLVVGDNDQACIEVCTVDSCQQFVFLIDIVPACAPLFSTDNLLITADDCSLSQEVCLEVPFAEVNNYAIQLNGNPYTGTLGPCTDGTTLSLDVGLNQLLFTNLNTNCIDSIGVDVVCITPDTILNQIPVLSQDSLCINLSELAGTPIFIENFCDSSSGEMVVFEIDSVNFCINYTGIEIGLDTACIVVCDDLGSCDTTIVIVEVFDGSIPPVASSDIDTTLFNTGTIINVMVNDTVPGGIDTLYVLDNPSNGGAVVNPDFTLSYAPDDGYCDPNTPDEFTYVVCNSSGCDTATVQVFVFCEELTFLTGFSPNGDGVNDTYIIRDIANLPDHTLTIFNRWGNQVLFTKDYQNDWDGIWEGQPLPDGTYFYVFEDGNGNVFSGYIQIHR